MPSRPAAPSATLLLALHACTPLEERIDIVYAEWCADDQDVTIPCVYDGDTAYLGECSESAKIRLLGVQAPEIDNSVEGTPAECYGYEAEAFLKELLEGEDVRLEYDVRCTDIYGRSLAWIFLEGYSASTESLLEELYGSAPDEILVNELLVRAGYAKVYRGDLADNVRYNDRLDEAEEAAEFEGRGLWSACE